MTFPEAIKMYRQRNLLPEEQVIAEQIEEYSLVERCLGCGYWLDIRISDGCRLCLACGQEIEYPALRNHLSEAIVTLVAHDAGQPAPDAKDASRPWCEDHDRALLDCLLSLAREVVELRVRMNDTQAALAAVYRQHLQLVAELRGGAA